MSAEVHHDEPKHDEPKHDEPKHDEPKHDEPKHDEPKDDEPEDDEPEDDEPEDDEPEDDDHGSDDDKGSDKSKTEGKADKKTSDAEGTSGLGVAWRGIKKVGRGVKKGATTLDAKVQSKTAKIAVPITLVASIAGLVWKVVDRPPPPEVIAPMSDTELREFIKEVYDPNHVEVHEHITFKISAQNFQFKLEGVSAESIQSEGQTINKQVNNPTDATPLPYYTIVGANRDAFGTPMMTLQFAFEEKGKRCVYETERLVLDRRNIANFPRTKITAHLVGAE